MQEAIAVSFEKSLAKEDRYFQDLKDMYLRKRDFTMETLRLAGFGELQTFKFATKFSILSFLIFLLPFFQKELFLFFQTFKISKCLPKQVQSLKTRSQAYFCKVAIGIFVGQ